MSTYIYIPEVRWSDQDMLGHVNNARMITLIEEGRIKWMDSLDNIKLTGGGLLVARQEIDYLRPVMYGPELRMTITVTRLGTSSYTVRTLGEQSGERAFDHSVVLVHIDRATQRPAPLPDRIRGVFAEYLEAASPTA